MLRGTQTLIRPLETDDLELLYKWYSDEDFTMAVSGGWPPASLLRREQITERFFDDDPYRYAITDLDGELIGTVGFDEVNTPARSARLFIGLGPENWGRGLGTDALRVFCRWLFRQWNFHRLTVETWAGNARAIACYRKLGFVLEGTLRESYYIGGAYRDGLMFGLLAGDTEAKA